MTKAKDQWEQEQLLTSSLIIADQSPLAHNRICLPSFWRARIGLVYLISIPKEGPVYPISRGLEWGWFTEPLDGSTKICQISIPWDHNFGCIPQISSSEVPLLKNCCSVIHCFTQLKITDTIILVVHRLVAFSKP